ncbi:MAG: hypothetical protein ABR508_01080 [Candidatus Baltobacteraceae bacterium]
MIIGPLVLAAALAAASPTPQPSPAPALKTIATVRSSSRCAEIITHANSAIGTTLANDLLVGRTIAALRYTNLDDGNPIHRRNGLNALGDMAKTLTQQARSGDDEVKRLRKLSGQTKDAAQAKELKDFADELGGALWRQQKIARDVNGLLAYEDMKDMAALGESDRNINIATVGVADPQSELPRDFAARDAAGRFYDPFPAGIGHDPNDPTATQYAKAAADDFAGRIHDIIHDETQAAGHIDGAVQNC